MPKVTIVKRPPYKPAPKDRIYDNHSIYSLRAGYSIVLRLREDRVEAFISYGSGEDCQLGRYRVEGCGPCSYLAAMLILRRALKEGLVSGPISDLYTVEYTTILIKNQK